MCGIAGELRLDETPCARTTLERMVPALARRGPDGEGLWLSGPVGLAHRRLAIIDLSVRSAQPMVDERLALALVFNGTIYNYPELRAQLAALGHRFVSDGDTEVILRAYAEWGESCVERLHGMFAFAIWDGRRRALFLARDRLGIKPLYFARTDRFFRFASNSQALLSAGEIDTRLDPVGLQFQFRLHGAVPPPYTVLRGIRKLAQGTTLTLYADGRESVRRYWRLPPPADPPPLMSEQEWIERLRYELREAVRQRLEIADVKVGVLLSGGLDSSLIVALAYAAGASDLMTFSIGFEDSPEERGDEFEYSDAVARFFGTRHHRYRISNEEVLARLSEAISAMAEPLASQDAASFYLLAERVRESVKVVQTGQGADELFAGYSWHAKMAADAGPALDRLERFYFDRPYEALAEMLTAPYSVPDDRVADFFRERFVEEASSAFLDTLLRIEATWLVTDDPVKRVDSMTMAWGVEARTPFLDHRFVEFVVNMPATLKLGADGMTNKYALKQVARDLLPDFVVDRPKGYFPMPALKYVRGSFFAFMREILNSDACRRRGLYRREFVDKLLANPEHYRTKIEGSTLWHMAVLELWLQQNVDSRPWQQEVRVTAAGG
ncbi:MAG: N-acetylglutaminylglutamine amidotransferase [Hydrogenophilus sp.]|nr:N-acetylglutaminylglutamine amidotransferase [Hydrogenophilus sp.]